MPFSRCALHKVLAHPARWQRRRWTKTSPTPTLQREARSGGLRNSPPAVDAPRASSPAGQVGGAIAGLRCRELLQGTDLACSWSCGFAFPCAMQDFADSPTGGQGSSSASGLAALRSIRQHLRIGQLQMALSAAAQWQDAYTAVEAQAQEAQLQAAAAEETAADVQAQNRQLQAALAAAQAALAAAQQDASAARADCKERLARMRHQHAADLAEAERLLSAAEAQVAVKTGGCTHHAAAFVHPCMARLTITHAAPAPFLAQAEVQRLRVEVDSAPAPYSSSSSIHAK